MLQTGARQHTVSDAAYFSTDAGSAGAPQKPEQPAGRAGFSWVSPMRTPRLCRLIAARGSFLHATNIERGEPDRIGVSTDRVLDALGVGQRGGSNLSHRSENRGQDHQKGAGVIAGTMALRASFEMHGVSRRQIFSCSRSTTRRLEVERFGRTSEDAAHR